MSLASTPSIEPREDAPRRGGWRRPGNGGERSAPKLFAREGLFCAALLLLLLLVIWPVVDSGVSDDWSYIKTVQVFVHTGHFAYNGWGAPLLGWMVPWGALSAKLFGASFTAIRLSMLPLAALCALLYERILRGFGLNRAHAVFGALTLVLCPEFLSMSTMFMTDVPGVLAVLLCIYLCQRALEAETDGAVLGWLIAAGAGNLVAGSVRQIAWLGVLVMVPCCGWLLRRRRHVLWVTAVMWAISVAAIGASIHWLNSQPFSVPEKLIPGRVSMAILPNIVHAIVLMAVTGMLICLPVFAMALYGWRRLPKRALPGIGLALGVLGAAVLLLRHFHIIGIFPQNGPMANNNIPGAYTSITGRWEQAAIELALAISVGVFVALSWERGPVRDNGEVGAISRQRWSSMLMLLAPFGIAYVGMLLPRATFVSLYDRYLLVPAAVGLILLLRVHQDRLGARVPWPGIAMLAASAAIGVAGTHDIFSMYRARVAVTREMARGGVPRTAIRGGFEYDAITQVDAWGSLNDPRVVIPGHPYVALPETVYAEPCSYWFARFTPAVQPVYVITRGRDFSLPGTTFAPVGYDTWLPPGVHALYVERTSGCP